MIIFWAVAAALCNYRLSVALAQEEGPLELFMRLRNQFTGDNWLGRGVRCFKCISFWLAVPLALLVGFDSWRHAILLWGGIAGLPLILDRYWSR